jgi:hypothetical protein
MPDDRSRFQRASASEYHRPTDREVRAIAQTLLTSLDRRPEPDPALEIVAKTHELAPEDEDRVEFALVELGIDFECTAIAEREASR